LDLGIWMPGVVFASSTTGFSKIRPLNQRTNLSVEILYVLLFFTYAFTIPLLSAVDFLDIMLHE
jgi:hypothetical protein